MEMMNRSTKASLLLMHVVLIALGAAAAAAASPTAFVAKVVQASGSRFFLDLAVGTPSQPQLLLLDLGSDLTQLQCSSHNTSASNSTFNPFASSTFTYLPCGTSCPPQGRLASDRLTLNSTTGSSVGAPSAVNHVQFACQNARNSGAVEVAALSSNRLALPAQFASRAGLARRFAYCLPSSLSSPGPIFFGGGVDYILPAQTPLNVSATLSFTTLHIIHGLYALSLEGITVDGTSLQITPQTLQIGTSQPYTKLTSSLYSALRSSFASKAASRNLTAAPAVAPFDTCYLASSASSTLLGPGVPEIDLHLQGNVTWQIFGLNSVVSVSDSVKCLAFLDAGVGQPSVLGTFQQQDNFVEFDLENSRVGFSGLLDAYRTVCANFNF